MTSLGSGRVEQGPDPDELRASAGRATSCPMPTADAGRRRARRRPAASSCGTGETEVRTDKGAVSAELDRGRPRRPAHRGPVRPGRPGRLPEDAGEVVVNQVLADKGYAVGETARPARGRPGGPDHRRRRRVDHDPRLPDRRGSARRLRPRDRATASSGWSTADRSRGRRCASSTTIGATVASRAVITDPPPASEWPDEVQDYGGTDEATVAVLVLIVVMALIEVVLLAGPAFAVGARKQQRSLALMSAAGGTPVQSRRVIIGSAIVLGSVAARRRRAGRDRPRPGCWCPVVQSRSGCLPRTVRRAVAAPGRGRRLRAAQRVPGRASCRRTSPPARTSSRCSPAAAATGAPSLRSPLLGPGAARRRHRRARSSAPRGGGEFVIAAGAIPAVLGMILLIPLVLAALGRSRAAAAGAAVRRARRGPAPHPHRAGRRRGRGDRRRRGGARASALTSDEAENRETYQAVGRRRDRHA